MPKVIPQPILEALGIIDPWNSQYKLYMQVSAVLHREYYNRLSYHHIEPDTQALTKMAKYVRAHAQYTLLGYLSGAARNLAVRTIEQARDHLKTVVDPTDTNQDAAEEILEALRAVEAG